MKKIYFVTNVLPKIHGGRTGSLLYRAKLLNSRGQNLTIISTNYNPNYPAVYQSFRDSKKVLHNTEFLNIYDYYKENSQTNDKILVWSEVLKEESEELSSLTQVIRSRKGGRSYYYKEGIPKYVIKESKQGIEFFAVYDEWNFNPSKYYFVNEEGLIHRIDYYDVENNLTRQEFLNNQGKIYLRKKFNLKNISEICLKKEELILFLNRQFTSQVELFLRKRGTKKYQEIPTVKTDGKLGVMLSFFEELISENNGGVLRYDLYVKKKETDFFQSLISNEATESNQYEKIISTDSSHQFVKIYTTLGNSLAIATANFHEGIVLTDIDDKSKKIIFRDFSNSSLAIKWNNNKTLEVETQENIKEVTLSEALNQLPFFKEKHLLSQFDNTKSIKIQYGLIKAHYIVSLSSYESLALKSNAKQDIVKATRITSLDTHALIITQKTLVIGSNFKDKIKIFIKKRGSKNYRLIQELSHLESKIKQQKIFGRVEEELSFSGVYDFFFSNASEEVYYPLNLTASLEKVLIFSEGNSISLEYYATKNNNLALLVKQIATTDIQATLISYNRKEVIFDFKKQIASAELLIVKRKNKSERYSVPGHSENTCFKFIWDNALDSLGKEQVGAIYDFYIRTTLPNGNQAIHRLTNTEEMAIETEDSTEIKDDKQRYLDIIELIENSHNIHNQTVQPYLTLNNKWSLHKGRAYNLKKNKL
ncbi:hypothetical protein [Lactococcus petauri]|uniref:hypothetical protein n=1 Tax=Lactococcus petauri TaxID=1940789 RepID=UPI0022E8B1A0|nr:hypothetical protein [Lactococcus petauri]